MSGGSAKRGRKRAAGAALQYEHRPGRVVDAKPKQTGFGWALACLGLLAALALVPMGVAEQTGGAEVWGELAPSWPGGGYAFAVCVGALFPLSFAALIAPLGRLNWKKRKLRSLAWAAASLPGLAVFQLLAAVITATIRPKHREDWDGFCYSKGNPCWVHVHYPFLWAVGLLATLAGVALLITLLVRYAPKSPASPT